MSLFGSLFTGVSGLGAQSQSTAMISNNIANVNTVGFKRSEASFFSLVTTESRSSQYSPGTVSANRKQLVNQQGPIQQTSSSTDAAISGNGMFAVKRGTQSGQEFLYTRSGSFSEDAEGLLRNSAGFVLYGWPLGEGDSLPPNQGDQNSLVPVDVAFLGGLTRPTSQAELAINLNADTVDKTLSDIGTVPADFTRSITVYDTLGSPQILTMSFAKTYGPQATANGGIGSLQATNHLVNDMGLTNGDQFTINYEGGLSRTYEINDGAAAPSGTADTEIVTLNDLITDIKDFFNDDANQAGLSLPQNGLNAFIGNNGELVVQHRDFRDGAANFFDLTNDIGSPLLGLGLTAGTYESNDIATGYDNGDPTDSPPYSSGIFPSPSNLPDSPNYNGRGWWEATITHPDGSTLSNGLMNFRSDGTMNARRDSDGNIDINLSQIDWGNGSSPQNIDIDIERFSQFSGNFDVIFSDQNGAELGLRTGVELTRDGFVVARFSNGATANLYKVPLVTFANPNGLQEVSGTAYSKNRASGEENLREAGTGGAGFLESSIIEASNVDLADEFAKLIVSQRAFSANTRTISTVDQMTEELLRLR